MTMAPVADTDPLLKPHLLCGFESTQRAGQLEAHPGCGYPHRMSTRGAGPYPSLLACANQPLADAVRPWYRPEATEPCIRRQGGQGVCKLQAARCSSGYHRDVENSYCSRNPAAPREG